MHGFEGAPEPKAEELNDNRPWFTLLNRYHWFVLIVAALGWLFDTMDQQLFNLARTPAMKELLKTPAGPPSQDDIFFYGGISTMIFLIGWALGGLFFGVLGDRVGRAKVMLWTILIYSLCTGLSALSVSIWDFSFYRFVTGLGVGGEFAVGVSLVAEVMPAKARPFALGLLQALSAVGNITAAFINMGLGIAEGHNALAVGETQFTAWRIMFVVGTLPALLAILIRRNLKEPERWQAAAKSGAKQQLGSYGDLFADPVLRRNALLGLAMGFAGVVGLWGIGFFSFDLLSPVFTEYFKGKGLSEADVKGQVTWWIGITSVLQNIGGFFGIYAYSYVTHYIGRKPAFFISFLAAMASTAMVFAYLDTFAELWMIPVMGFCQLALFGGYAIYFPELFPTRLRSTGTSFCYNVGRLVAAVGPLTLGMLTKVVFSQANGFENGVRWAGVTMCSVFVIGLIALPFLPETKGKPLPE
ncbi:MAG: MFS transporter [Pirellulaceae bacterium]|nr:MFS transporter [Pirellulaceae bacterium]